LEKAMGKSLIFDTETTGLLKPSVTDLKYQPKIIELGVIVVEDGKETQRYSQLLNPEEEITEEITRITGITNEMLEGKPFFRKILAELEELFAGADELICHNAPFDVGMLENELKRCARTGFPWPPRITCTVQEFRHEFGGKYVKLINLYEAKLGKKLEQTHRAVDDCEALLEILTADKYFEG
jgi:DNA polymerase III subunit alpha, Gram-positive type